MQYYHKFGRLSVLRLMEVAYLGRLFLMQPSVKSALSKHSDGSRWGASDINPPTPADAKLRLKHVSDSVPYNTAHAVDHLDEIVNQLQKLSSVDRSKTKQLASGAAKRVSSIVKKLSKYGGKNGR